MKVLALVAASLLILTGCNESSNTGAKKPTVDQSVVDYASTAMPADKELASIYQRSCRQCHSIRGTNAPLSGDEAAWQERIDLRGMDGLLQSTKNGIGIMPPRGMCYDCSDEQYNALINFMIGGEK